MFWTALNKNRCTKIRTKMRPAASGSSVPYHTTFSGCYFSFWTPSVCRKMHIWPFSTSIPQKNTSCWNGCCLTHLGQPPPGSSQLPSLQFDWFYQTWWDFLSKSKYFRIFMSFQDKAQSQLQQVEFLGVLSKPVMKAAGSLARRHDYISMKLSWLLFLFPVWFWWSCLLVFFFLPLDSPVSRCQSCPLLFSPVFRCTLL